MSNGHKDYPAKCHVEFGVRVDSRKNISVRGSRFVVEQGHNQGYTYEEDQAYREQRAIECMNSRPAGQRGIVFMKASRVAFKDRDEEIDCWNQENPVN
jgi:hypothetical protein